MPIIKRYPNRKLYDTEAKQYITLDGIATLVRQGREVTVVDYASGEDLTALTLAQVILEQEKRRSGFLPEAVLTGLIRAGGDTLSTLRRTMAPALNLARHVDEEIERRIQDLVARGEVAAGEGRRLRDKLLGLSYRQPKSLQPNQDDLEQALMRQDVPTSSDLQRLVGQLETLAAKLEEVSLDRLRK